MVAYAVLINASQYPEAILRHAREVLGFKRPKRLYLMSELPKNPAGKIQKKALRPELAQRLVHLKESSA